MERKRRIEDSEQVMCVRYKTMIGLGDCPALYQSCLDDSKRKTITRWRLSSHKLKIETGRYCRPQIEREHRLCQVCKVVEDESHAIFDCRAHRLIRDRYCNSLGLQSRDIKHLFNPGTVDDAKNLAAFLDEIEDNMKDLTMR